VLTANSPRSIWPTKGIFPGTAERFSLILEDDMCAPHVKLYVKPETI
jgi:hypothetical protein